MDTHLRAIKAFIRVAEKRSFSAVARELDMSQPQVSRLVAQLEESVGTALLHRDTRSVVLSDAGAVFLEHAQRAIGEIDRGLQQILGERGIGGSLRIATATGPFRYLLMPGLDEFLRLHPQCRLDVVISDQRENLLAQGIDLAFRAGELGDSALLATRMCDVPRLVVASPDYLQDAAARGLPPPLTPGALSHHDCVLYSGWDDPHWNFESDQGHERVPVSARVTVSVVEAVRDFVLRGYGLGLVADFLVRDDIAAGRLVHLMAHYRIRPLRISALMPSSKRDSMRVRALLEHMRGYLSERYA